MKSPTPTRITATFIVRLWSEAGPDQPDDWRGQVEHVQSGERHYFVELSKMLGFIADHLGREEAVDRGPGRDEAL